MYIQVKMIPNYIQNPQRVCSDASDLEIKQDITDLSKKLEDSRAIKRSRSVDLDVASSRSSSCANSNSNSDSEFDTELCLSTAITGKYRVEILRFLKWFDSLSDQEIIRPSVPLPPTIGLSEKALDLLTQEGYIIYYHHPSYRYFIRLHGSKELPGTLDSDT